MGMLINSNFAFVARKNAEARTCPLWGFISPVLTTSLQFRQLRFSDCLYIY